MARNNPQLLVQESRENASELERRLDGVKPSERISIHGMALFAIVHELRTLCDALEREITDAEDLRNRLAKAEYRNPR